jgi:hypothetical protein
MTAPVPAESDIFARLTGVSELSLSVAADHELGAVTIDVHGLPGSRQAILASHHAASLAIGLLRCCHALRPPEEPGAGPLSSTY